MYIYNSSFILFYTIALNYININIFTGTLTWSVSPKTIYTHNTGFDQSLCGGRPLDWGPSPKFGTWPWLLPWVGPLLC